MASTAPQNVPRMTPEKLKALIDTEQAISIVDVRQPAAYNSSPLTILGAIRIPPDEIPQRYQEIPRNQPVITFCT
jgi:rhodanese-related sulfurtransferase